MNLNQLEYFVSAAENLNFTRAAAQCFISQTAMTQQIQSLEKTVGVPLFIRDKHHVELTTAGKVFLKEARAILERSNSAIRNARMAVDGTEGELDIGFISGFGESDCPELLKSFHNAYPNIKLALYRDTMSGLIDSINQGKLDVAFTIALRSDQSVNVQHRYIKSYPLMAVLYAGHPLGSREKLRYSELINENFIIMQPSGRSRDEMEETILIYERGGFLPNILAFEKEPETIMLMIALGMGIAIMPEYIVRHYRRDPDFRIVPVEKNDGTSETLGFEMAWSENNGNLAIESLIRWVKEME